MSAIAEKLPKYNGWANYPTWAVALVFDNNEELYTYARERAYKSMTFYCRKYGTETGLNLAAMAFLNWAKRQVRFENPYAIREDLRDFSKANGHRTYLWALNLVDERELFADFLPDEHTVELPA